MHLQCCAFKKLFIQKVVHSKCYAFKILYIQNVMHSKCCALKMLCIQKICAFKLYAFKMFAGKKFCIQNVCDEILAFKLLHCKNLRWDYTDPKKRYLWMISVCLKKENLQVVEQVCLNLPSNESFLSLRTSLIVYNSFHSKVL